MDTPPLQYFSPDSYPRSPRRASIANPLWFSAGAALTVISFYIWTRQGDEPFYGGGGTYDRFIYRLLTPPALIGWLAWAVWGVRRVYRRRLRARWLVFFFWSIVCSYMILTSLNVYLSDQGMRSEFIDWLSWRVYDLTHW
jgi:hypothetical protein